MNTLFVQEIKHKKSGVTLIELLLYISVSAILLMISSMFLSLLLRSRVKNQTMAEVGQQGIQIMQIMTQTIRNADGITTPSQGSSGTTLTLAMADGAVNPTTFQFIGNGVQMQEGTGSPLSLSSSRIIISNASLRNLSRPNTPGIVRIQFTLSHTNPVGRNEYSFSRTFTTSSALRHP